jgi:hypothetical protein
MVIRRRHTSPDDGQQATMKNAYLLAKRPPDNQQRFD